MAKKGLGRGLDALLADNEIESSSGGVTVLRLTEIEPNRGQARKVFDPSCFVDPTARSDSAARCQTKAKRLL